MAVAALILQIFFIIILVLTILSFFKCIYESHLHNRKGDLLEYRTNLLKEDRNDILNDYDFQTMMYYKLTFGDFRLLRKEEIREN